MTCTATLGGFPGGLVCTRDHDDKRGCIFQSTSGGDAEAGYDDADE